MAGQPVNLHMGQIWEKQTEAFIIHLRASGSPESTIGQRAYHLRRLAREVGGTPATLSLDRLVEWLAGHEWAPNTRRAYRGSLRAFYGWAMATGRVRMSPAHLLPPVRVPRGKPRPTPEHIYRAALERADDRVKLAIMLAAQCGLRRGEISRVRRDHLIEDLLGYSLRVVGKGGHVRDVPLPDELATRLLEAPAGWVFPSTARGGEHLTEAHVGKLVSRLLPDGWTCHTLRHRCGSIAYQATKDLRAVQELLGHAKPETTQLYTPVPPSSIRAAMAAAAVA